MKCVTAAESIYSKLNLFYAWLFPELTGAVRLSSLSLLNFNSAYLFVFFVQLLS